MRTLTLTAALTLGRPVWWASDVGVVLVALIVGAAFTLYVARWAWRITEC